MLNKAMRAKTKMLSCNYQFQNLIKMAQYRQVHTIPRKLYAVPESVNDVIKYLDDKRPIFTCLYFHASWNPICKKIDKDYD